MIDKKVFVGAALTLGKLFLSNNNACQLIAKKFPKPGVQILHRMIDHASEQIQLEALRHMYWALSNVLATQPLCEEFCHHAGAVKALVDHIFKTHESTEPADLNAQNDSIFSLCNLVTECSP